MSERMKILAVVGARPNFVKIAALEKAFRAYPQVGFQIVHTGQHYDPSLDEVFFRELDIPKPDFHLGVGSDTSNRQLGQMLLGLEPVLEKTRPHAVLVVGDTTSALAGALAASGTGIPIAHVEAGLRSGDRSMPEEINRILTDTVSDFLFVTEQAGLENLEKEGVAGEKVFFTGNCMMDTLMLFRDAAARTAMVQRLGLTVRQYALVTLHRPSNVDTEKGLETVIRILEAMSEEIPLVFPVHPRTAGRLKAFGWMARLEAIADLRVIEPQGYLEFLNLLENAALALTDSGGIQDETTFLGIPCLTLRTTTERPVTLSLGTNELIEVPDPGLIRQKVQQIREDKWKTGIIPERWDGQSARRIAAILIQHFPLLDERARFLPARSKKN
ncbi:MAG: UDP-2,3-diacetamido-2,3-dideoxy-D-glucuronate 2-epimerase [Saprospiraceae bacterium]|nr:UDP-2,3-diacetamido-2,3-dideoxy-D-glucuronate 2-epimerase [Saprospiraceae bacterium]